MTTNDWLRTDSAEVPLNFSAHRVFKHMYRKTLRHLSAEKIANFSAPAAQLLLGAQESLNLSALGIRKPMIENNLRRSSAEKNANLSAQPPQMLLQLTTDN